MRFFDEEDRQAEAFYAEAEPCESCGKPCFEARVWNPEYEFWEGVECGCSTPEVATPFEPICRDLYAVLMSASTVGEMSDAAKQHKATCEACGGTPIVTAVESPVCSFAELLVAQSIPAGKLVDVYRKHAASCQKCRLTKANVELKEAA